MPSLVPSRSEARAVESEIAAINRPPVAEAREALTYWRTRESRLPWYRWEARREARVMASRWRERLLRARLERWSLQALAPALMPLARGRGNLGHGVVRWLVRPQGLARRAILLTAVTVLSAVAALVLLVVLAAEVVGHLV
jgi:hypothetical protein